MNHPRRPTSTRTGSSSHSRGLGQSWGIGRAAVSQEKGICLSPVLLWKSGTSLRPKYFLWGVAIRICWLGRDRSSVPPGSTALPRSHGPSPSLVSEHPDSCLAVLQGSEIELRRNLALKQSECLRPRQSQREAAPRPGSPRKPPRPVVQPAALRGTPWAPMGRIRVHKLPCPHSYGHRGRCSTHGGFEQQGPGRGSAPALAFS